MVRTPCFHCIGYRQVHSWSGELRPHMPHGMAKKIKLKRKRERVARKMGQTAQSNTIEMNANISVVAVNVNGLNASVRRKDC